MSKYPPLSTDEDADHNPQEDPAATPVCLGCLTPFDRLQHYCGHCGTVVGQFTPYIPYLNSPFNYSLYDRMWTRLWYPQGESVARRKVYVIMLIVLAFVHIPVWILLLGIPLWWWYRRKHPPPGFCAACGYDLRGGPHERCPECGASLTGEVSAGFRHAAIDHDDP